MEDCTRTRTYTRTHITPAHVHAFICKWTEVEQQGHMVLPMRGIDWGWGRGKPASHLEFGVIESSYRASTACTASPSSGHGSGGELLGQTAAADANAGQGAMEDGSSITNGAANGRVALRNTFLRALQRSEWRTDVLHVEDGPASRIRIDK